MQEIYLGNDFPAHASTWSEPECLNLRVKPAERVFIRFIKIQTVQVP
jgi:hypothetical protein